MKIGVVGTGYVGLVSGVCLADFGHNVICMDVDENKIEKLKNGKASIYEIGLEELIERNAYYKRIEFTNDIKKTVEESDVIFIAVGTPPKDDGSADLQYVLEVAKNIGKYINEYKVVIDKSTVPVGTGQLVKQTIAQELEKRGAKIDFDVVSNPEFLREGKAVYDFTHPDRVVIGAESEKAVELMKKVYRVLYLNQTPFVFVNIETAEMIKYASNAFLAVKISFINEMALLAEKVGANVQDIAKAMGKDGRISPKFLHAGPGYGGSCFPKDTKAIVDIAKKYDEEFFVIDAAIKANEKQKKKMVYKIKENIGDISGKTIAILGLSFKPETDDMREAPAIDIIKGLVKEGASIRAFCPQGIQEAKWRLDDISEKITYCNDEYDAAKGAMALVVITEWHQFRAMDLSKLKDIMSGEYFFDLRNIYSQDKNAKKIFKYFGVGVK